MSTSPDSSARYAEPPQILDPQQRFNIQQASALLKQSRSKTYNDIAAGTLRVIKDGRRTFVPGTEIARRSSLGAA